MSQKYIFSPRNLSQTSKLSTNKKPQQRAAFKMVPSVYEPPEETQASYKNLQNPKSSFQYALDPYQSNDSKENLYFAQNSNIEFVKSLIHLKNGINFEEGDSVGMDSEDRWIIASGQLKITGTNGYSYNASSGYIFFISPQTKRKVQEVTAMRSSFLYKIPQKLFRDNVRNFLYMKNAEKIKYLNYCPFLKWGQHLAEDVAATMQLVDDLEKDFQLYQYGDKAEYLYFIKEGIVLLERFGKVGNAIIKEYEKHYESTHLNEEESLLIVRKGMIFGVDGILIREKGQKKVNEESNPEEENPHLRYGEQQIPQNIKDTRIYNAKTVGRCQIYRLKKEVIETYFRTTNFMQKRQDQGNISEKELDRICYEYTNLLMGGNPQKSSLKKRQFELVENLNSFDEEYEKKKKKIQEIKEHDKKMKKIHAESIDFRRRNDKEVLIHQSPFKKGMFEKKEEIPQIKRHSNFSLPALQKKQIERLIIKKIDKKEGEKMISYKKKVEQYLEAEKTERKPEKNGGQFIKVKSYRSLISSMS